MLDFDKKENRLLIQLEGKDKYSNQRFYLVKEILSNINSYVFSDFFKRRNSLMIESVAF